MLLIDVADVPRHLGLEPVQSGAEIVAHRDVQARRRHRRERLCRPAGQRRRGRGVELLAPPAGRDDHRCDEGRGEAEQAVRRAHAESWQGVRPTGVRCQKVWPARRPGRGRSRCAGSPGAGRRLPSSVRSAMLLLPLAALSVFVSPVSAQAPDTVAAIHSITGRGAAHRQQGRRPARPLARPRRTDVLLRPARLPPGVDRSLQARSAGAGHPRLGE